VLGAIDACLQSADIEVATLKRRHENAILTCHIPQFGFGRIRASTRRLFFRLALVPKVTFMRCLRDAERRSNVIVYTWRR
jgi:hypothetical protein